MRNISKEATEALGREPVGRLLWQYALPSVIAMTASSLYNMVDSIFIGRGVGAMALSGLAVTFPLMNLCAAFGAAVGVGASTLMSLRLGQGQDRKARQVLGNMVALNLIIGIGVGVIALLFLDPILRFFGATDAMIPYARDYMEIILAGNVFTHLYFGLNSALRSAGRPRQAMIATIVTVLLNTALDPIFIWPLGLGIRGAAYATVLAQIIVLMWQMHLFTQKHELLHIEWREVKPVWHILREIINIGISPFAMNVTSCVVVIFINHALVKYGGDLAVGAYGISNRIGFVCFMIAFGIAQGMQPIAGYNYGAGKHDRTLRVLRLTIVSATIVMTTGFAIAELFPRACARLFTNDAQMVDMSARAIRISLAAFPLVGYQSVVTNFFQTIGKVRISIFMSLSRQLIFLLPLLLTMPLWWGLDGVWWSMPASDLIAFVTAVFILEWHKRRFRSRLSQSPK